MPLAAFDDLLANYTVDVKARMETGGACASQSGAMFNTNQSVTRAELARLKASNAVYAAWLRKPQGQIFEANLGDADEIKLVSYLGEIASLKSIAISPYRKRFLGLGGFYYPPQQFDLRYGE